MRSLLAILLLFVAAPPLFAQSVFTQRPVDPYAAYLEHGAYGAAADGVADDTPAIQAAIDHAAGTMGGGIVFVAEGRYRIMHTVHLWSGIWLIGYGVHRPVFVPGANTPGYREATSFLARAGIVPCGKTVPAEPRKSVGSSLESAASKQNSTIILSLDVYFYPFSMGRVLA